MEPRAALIAAIITGALAVGIVAVDHEFGLEAELQSMEGGEWVDVADDRYGPRYAPGQGCAAPELRLIVENEWIWGTSVDVLVSYWDGEAQQQVIALDDEWTLGAGESREHEWTIPASAFAGEGTEPADFKRSVYVDVQVGEQYLGVCVAQESA